MAQITLNIPDQHIALIIDSFAIAFGYDADVHQVTKAQFAKLRVRDYVKSIVAQAERGRRVQELSATIQTEIDGIDIT